MSRPLKKITLTRLGVFTIWEDPYQKNENFKKHLN